VGAVNLLGSNMWSAQTYAKLAIHEGYDQWPLPSIAIRGAVSRMMGQADLDLTIASADASISKAFGIVGLLAFEPYAGYSALVMIPRAEVIDKSPDEAADNLDFVLVNQDDIIRNRIFAGFTLRYHIITLIVEGNVILEGTSVDNRSGTDDDCANVGGMSANCDSTDQAALQQSFNLSLALDF